MLSHNTNQYNKLQLKPIAVNLLMKNSLTWDI